MRVEFFSTLRHTTGSKSIDMPAPRDVLALLNELAQRWPSLRGLVLNADGTDKGDYVMVMVNGRYINQLDGVATALVEEDVVAITPIVAGG